MNHVSHVNLIYSNPFSNATLQHICKSFFTPFFALFRRGDGNFAFFLYIAQSHECKHFLFLEMMEFCHNLNLMIETKRNEMFKYLTWSCINHHRLTTGVNRCITFCQWIIILCVVLKFVLVCVQLNFSQVYIKRNMFQQ